MPFKNPNGVIAAALLVEDWYWPDVNVGGVAWALPEKSNADNGAANKLARGPGRK
jgi:hypothetical protein